MTVPRPADPYVRPQPDGSDIRKVTEADVPRVSEVLARAFSNDPFWHWMYSDDPRFLSRVERSFELFLRRVWLPEDECSTHVDTIGAALWMPPGTAHLSIPRQLALLPRTAAVTRRYFGRAMRVLAAMDAKHPRDPHWYLAVVGVDPEWHGRGFGSALMRPILERCDSERLPAYLEASTPRSRALYERNGFEVTEELTIKDSPPLWLMWREPQPRV